MGRSRRISAAWVPIGSSSTGIGPSSSCSSECRLSSPAQLRSAGCDPLLGIHGHDQHLTAVRDDRQRGGKIPAQRLMMLDSAIAFDPDQARLAFLVGEGGDQPSLAVDFGHRAHRPDPFGDLNRSARMTVGPHVPQSAALVPGQHMHAMLTIGRDHRHRRGTRSNARQRGPTRRGCASLARCGRPSRSRPRRTSAPSATGWTSSSRRSGPPSVFQAPLPPAAWRVTTPSGARVSPSQPSCRVTIPAGRSSGARRILVRVIFFHGSGTRAPSVPLTSVMNRPRTS